MSQPLSGSIGPEMQRDAERVPVESPTFVSLGDVGKRCAASKVNSLKISAVATRADVLTGLRLAPSVLDDVNGHQQPVSLWVCRLNFHWVLEAVLDRQLRVAVEIGTVHRLQKELRELIGLERLGVRLPAGRRVSVRRHVAGSSRRLPSDSHRPNRAAGGSSVPLVSTATSKPRA